jgi:hypothetical protein
MMSFIDTDLPFSLHELEAESTLNNQGKRQSVDQALRLIDAIPPTERNKKVKTKASNKKKKPIASKSGNGINTLLFHQIS